MSWLTMLLAGAVLLVGPGPVSEVELAPGQSARTTDPGRALFPAERRWVPGDVETAQFRLRNGGPSAASVWIALAEDQDPLVAHGHVLLEARLDAGTWRPLTPVGGRAQLTRAPLPAGETAIVTLRASFSATAGNTTQRSHAGLPLLVGMAGDQAGDRPPGDDLPTTGARVGAALVVLAVVAVLGGAVLAWRSRGGRDD